MEKAKSRRMKKSHDGKRSFPTLEAAQAAAKALARLLDKKGIPIVTFLRAYGCQCGNFHFGKTKEIDWSKVSKLDKKQMANSQKESHAKVQNRNPC